MVNMRRNQLLLAYHSTTYLQLFVVNYCDQFTEEYSVCGARQLCWIGVFVGFECKDLCTTTKSQFTERRDVIMR